MIKLNEIYISGSVEEALDKALERYNAAHPGRELSYQDYCESLLENAIFTAEVKSRG